MKRFRFALRPVAVLRAHRELRAREAFAASVHAYVQAEEELARARTRASELEQVLFAGRRERFGAHDEAEHLLAYRKEIAVEGEAERAAIAAREEMQRLRHEYIEAHRNLEVVKRLEEKARGHYRLEVNREEQNEFDEFAGRSAARRSAVRA